MSRDLLFQRVDHFVRASNRATRRGVVYVIVFGADPDGEELCIEATRLETSKVSMGPQSISTWPPRKPGEREVNPRRAVLSFPTVHSEVEPEVVDPDGDVVVAADDDRIAVYLRRPLLQGWLGGANQTGAAAAGRKRQGKTEVADLVQLTPPSRRLTFGRSAAPESADR